MKAIRTECVKLFCKLAFYGRFVNILRTLVNDVRPNL